MIFIGLISIYEVTYQCADHRNHQQQLLTTLDCGDRYCFRVRTRGAMADTTMHLPSVRLGLIMRAVEAERSLTLCLSCLQEAICASTDFVCL